MELLLNLLELFITFFKIGLFTFGGGHAMIPLVTEEVVNRSWASLDLVIDFIAIAESTPGTIAINMATFVGFEQQFILGALFTTLGVMLPSFIIIIIIAKIFHHFSDNTYVVGFLNGVKPIVVGVIFSVGVDFVLDSVFDMKEVTLFDQFMFDWRTIVILAVIFTLTRFKERAHPIFIVVLSGILGYIFFGIL
ncbi:MAG TPA: chromate transporter [Candidatus Izemoplasmatales bacterium]|nr:chromate transporter [Candidatus Izemoplasmatales bacterium]